MQRPKFGQRIRARDRAARVRLSSHELAPKYGYYVKWERQRSRGYPYSAEPVEGIYIGWRTCSNGQRWFENEVGIVYDPMKHFELWLIVPNERSAPVYVFPDDVDL